MRSKSKLCIHAHTHTQDATTIHIIRFLGLTRHSATFLSSFGWTLGASENLKAAGSRGKTWQCWRVVPMASPSLLPCDTQEPLKDIEGWRVRWKMAMTMQFGPSKIKHSVPSIDVSCDFNCGALGSLSQYLTVATVADLAPPVPSGTRPTSRVQET